MKIRLFCTATLSLAMVSHGLAASPSIAVSDKDPAVHVPAFDLPASSFLSPQAQMALRNPEVLLAEWKKACPIDPESLANRERVVAWRKCHDDKLIKPLVARQRSRYAVRIDAAELGGVLTEIITPAEGVSFGNRQRVLINLHGGGFISGARWEGQGESIPIAALGKITVVSVDYRMAPEHQFPAASEDVAAVYRTLLKDYKPENIGIYGCSAGGILTAQTVAWLQKESLPAPGAVGLFCAAGSYYFEGDSGYFVAALLGIAPAHRPVPHNDSYFKDTDTNDPLVFPVRLDEVLKKFPPVLLVTATRDQSLSSVVHMHSRLVALGVEAQLHVWEGLGHGFFADPDLP